MHEARITVFCKKVCFQLTTENAKTQELGHEDRLAANSRSTGPQQQNTDDHNSPFDTAERSSSADWRTAGVDY